MNSTFAIFLDLLLAGLMIATIVYAVSLNRSIGTLRDGKADLAVLLRNLAESVAHADLAIKGMKNIANEYDTSLSKQIGTARALADELQVMNESANNLAARIERASQTGKPAPQPREIAAPVAAVAPVRPAAARPAAMRPPRFVESPGLVDAMDALAAQPVRGQSAPAEPQKKKPSGRGVERELVEAIELLRRSA